MATTPIMILPAVIGNVAARWLFNILIEYWPSCVFAKLVHLKMLTIPTDPAKWSTLVPEVWAMSLLMSWMIEYRTGNEAGVANEAKRGWLLKGGGVMRWSKNITSCSKVSTKYYVPTISATLFILPGVAKEKHSVIVTRYLHPDNTGWKCQPKANKGKQWRLSCIHLQKGPNKQEL